MTAFHAIILVYLRLFILKKRGCIGSFVWPARRPYTPAARLLESAQNGTFWSISGRAGRKIDEITRGDMLRFREELTRSLSTRRVNQVLGVLKTVFRDALFREELDRDPTAGIGLMKNIHMERSTFSFQELRLLFPSNSLGSWADKADCAIYLLAGTTGIRRGEILGLRWADIDLEDRVVRAERSLKLYWEGYRSGQNCAWWLCRSIQHGRCADGAG